MKILISFIYFSLLIVVTSAKSPLDCDFSGDCCWSTMHEDEQWEIRSADDLNMNEFRKTFLTGKSKPPPTGNYAIRIENKEKSSLISCPACSANGSVAVQFRHWQSPNAQLKICWQREGDGSPEIGNCHTAKHSRQSKLNTYYFDNLPQRKNFRLVMVIETIDVGSSNPESTIIVDGISVHYEACDAQKKRPKKSSNLAKYEKLNNANKQKPYLKSADKEVAKVVEELNHTILKSTTPLPITSKPAVVDPLTDLLGKEFVEFLDPNYVSNDDEKSVEDTDAPDTKLHHGDSTTLAPSTSMKPLNIKRVETKDRTVHPEIGVVPSSTTPSPQPVPSIIAAPSVTSLMTRGKPLAVQTQNAAFGLPTPTHHQLPLGVPSSCPTIGGCLFETDFCTWTTPNGIENKFHIKKVHTSSFAEAIVPSGEISVMETDTDMSQSHTILFDALEFANGVRLIGCCVVDNQLSCPFATPLEQTGILWQFSKFDCPVNTKKIAFICENYGLGTNVCGVDNIRLHASTDVFYLEPCARDQLH